MTRNVIPITLFFHMRVFPEPSEIWIMAASIQIDVRISLPDTEKSQA